MQQRPDDPVGEPGGDPLGIVQRIRPRDRPAGEDRADRDHHEDQRRDAVNNGQLSSHSDSGVAAGGSPITAHRADR